MPANNRFRHQPYPTQPVISPRLGTLRVDDAAEIDFSKLHTELGIREVMLVHGTFMGDDPFAIAEMLRALAGETSWLGKSLSSLGDKLQEKMKPTAEKVTGDVGNYTQGFRDEFARLVGGDPIVRLMEPTWSGQNHHLARADLAVRLLCYLDDLHLNIGERVLFWGHSHAGNGFAILSNLLSNDRESINQFFETVGLEAGEHWLRARSILADASSPHPWA